MAKLSMQHHLISIIFFDNEESRPSKYYASTVLEYRATPDLYDNCIHKNKCTNLNSQVASLVPVVARAQHRSSNYSNYIALGGKTKFMMGNNILVTVIQGGVYTSNRVWS